MQLVAYGMQDVYLTGNSQVTFFKNLYRRHTNFSVEAVQQTFQSSSRAFGNRLVSVVSRNGDLLHRVWLEVSLRAQTADVTYVNNLCHALVKSAEVEIGGQRIDRVYGRFSHLWHKLTCRAGKEFGFDIMAGCGGVPGDADSQQAAPSFATSRKVFIPIDFFFSKGRAGSALPLIALQYHEVRITIELADKDEILRSVQVRDYEGTESQISHNQGRRDNDAVVMTYPLETIKTELQGWQDEASWITTLNTIKDFKLSNIEQSLGPVILTHLDDKSNSLYSVLIDRNKINYSNNYINSNFGVPNANEINTALVKIDEILQLAISKYDPSSNDNFETLKGVAETQKTLIKNSGLFEMDKDSGSPNFVNINNALSLLKKAEYNFAIVGKISQYVRDNPLRFIPDYGQEIDGFFDQASLYFRGAAEDSGNGYTGVYQENGVDKNSLRKIYTDLEVSYPKSVYKEADLVKLQILHALTQATTINNKVTNIQALAEHTKNKALGEQGTLNNDDFESYLGDLPLADIGFSVTSGSYSSAEDFARLTHAAKEEVENIKYDIMHIKTAVQAFVTKFSIVFRGSLDQDAQTAKTSLDDISIDSSTINGYYSDAVKALLVNGYFVGGYLSTAAQDIVDFEQQPRLFTDFFFLDTEERRRFSQMSHEYLIEQLQFLGTEVTPKLSQGSEVPFSMELDFNHPTKALYWTTEVSDGNKARRNPFYNGLSETEPNTLECRSHQGIYDNCPVASVSLNLNGHDRFSPRDGEYFWLCQPYQHHRRVPHDHWLGMYSFCLKPEEHQPSGTLNFSRIDAARLTMHFKSHTSECRRDVYVYALNYNVLRILSGMGGLAFSN